jgi:hypothetical protein
MRWSIGLRWSPRDALDDLGLVGLADGLEVGDGLVAFPDLARDRLVPVDDLLHPGFDGGQIVEAERLSAGEVVVETVLDGRTDRHLRAGEQLLHRLGHDVAGVVAQGLQRLASIARQDLEMAAAGQWAVHVIELALQLDEGGALGERRRDGGRHGLARHAVVVLAFRAVGENQVDHVSQVHLRDFSRGGGTGSKPEPPPQGWQRHSRRTVRRLPRHGPWPIRASAA